MNCLGCNSKMQDVGDYLMRCMNPNCKAFKIEYDIEPEDQNTYKAHIRLIGLNQKVGENPTELHIGIEIGGTLTDLKGDTIWSGLVSAESFEETMKTYNESKRK